MARKKDAVFLAHTFDDCPPSGSSVSDVEVAAWFEKLLKKKWRVLSGKTKQARPIGDKVADAVDDSRAIVGVFTRRFPMDEMGDRFVASPWVLCECAYALGRFRYAPYIVAGFREKGVDPDSLAMLTVGGMEFPEFDRDNLEASKPEVLAYLNDLEARIHAGGLGQLPLPITLPYAQVRLEKIHLVYRNGYGTIQNITEMVIRDPERFLNEHQGSIRHRIRTYRGKLPPLMEMLETPVHQRKTAPFFHGILDYHRSKSMGTPLQVMPVEESTTDVAFAVGFVDEAGAPLRLKANDTVRYQYAWGLPGMFPAIEEDLAEVVRGQVDSDTYCLAEVTANHGRIEKVQLDIRFEREATGGRRREILSKSPFWQIGRGYEPNPVWSEPRPVPQVRGEQEEYDMWYEIFRLGLVDFDGRVRIAWRPASQK